MELAICDCYDSCRVSFQQLVVAFQNPARDFSNQITVAIVRDEQSRFEVWAGNVGARHDPKSPTSLLLGKRGPIEECATPPGSPTESDTDDSSTEPGSDIVEEDDKSSSQETNLSKMLHCEL
ncbi:hypothetical protein AOQ84DRAFT_377158 [Glonium stellatum]|uniref:Uncharacterized protein n=1 Tax=Glonium stellatum TaxID=574774 RepID=A0A8E2F0H2_9PEZI|nr:hypothetical protein AOQ84DRAFT_377158 [Glonium stellatum]